MNDNGDRPSREGAPVARYQLCKICGQTYDSGDPEQTARHVHRLPEPNEPPTGG